MDNWIDDAEQPPDKSGYFLCWAWKNKPTNGHCKICWFAWNQMRWQTLETVTHWMPLPTEPQYTGISNQDDTLGDRQEST